MEITNTGGACLERAAEGLFERSLHRHRRHDCADVRGMQGRHGPFLQRDLGLCAAGGLPGQYQRSALPGQPPRQRRQPRGVRALDRSGRRIGAPYAGEITLRGDTDFGLTGELDRWDGKAVKFLLGMDAHPKVVKLAEALPQEAWQPLERLPRYEIVTRPRRKPERVKESIVRLKGYENKVLVGESFPKSTISPASAAAYRLIIVRKNISVQKGEQVLFDEIRYFFYITNRDDYNPEQIVSLANGRCDQENVIEQLKNGVNAMRMPVDDLLSNWAYMVMTSLAWNLKAWFGLALARCSRRRGVDQDGVSALPARDHLAARADRAHRQTRDLPDHGL